MRAAAIAATSHAPSQAGAFGSFASPDFWSISSHAQDAAAHEPSLSHRKESGLGGATACKDPNPVAAGAVGAKRPGVLLNRPPETALVRSAHLLRVDRQAPGRTGHDGP